MFTWLVEKGHLTQEQADQAQELYSHHLLPWDTCCEDGAEDMCEECMDHCEHPNWEFRGNTQWGPSYECKRCGGITP